MATGTFTAKYHGECSECGNDLQGAEVTFAEPGRLVHVTCPDSLLEAPSRTELCQRCFCYHKGECW